MTAKLVIQNEIYVKRYHRENVFLRHDCCRELFSKNTTETWHCHPYIFFVRHHSNESFKWVASSSMLQWKDTFVLSFLVYKRKESCFHRIFENLSTSCGWHFDLQEQVCLFDDNAWIVSHLHATVDTKQWPSSNSTARTAVCNHGDLLYWRPISRCLGSHNLHTHWRIILLLYRWWIREYMSEPSSRQHFRHHVFSCKFYFGWWAYWHLRSHWLVKAWVHVIIQLCWWHKA